MISAETKEKLLLAYRPPFNKLEFLSDVNKIVAITKLIDKWIHTGECNYRLLLNNVIMIRNAFGEVGLLALYEYLESHRECIPAIYSILFYLGLIRRPAIYDVELYQRFVSLYHE